MGIKITASRRHCSGDGVTSSPVDGVGVFNLFGNFPAKANSKRKNGAGSPLRARRRFCILHLSVAPHQSSDGHDQQDGQDVGRPVGSETLPVAVRAVAATPAAPASSSSPHRQTDSYHPTQNPTQIAHTGRPIAFHQRCRRCMNRWASVATISPSRYTAHRSPGRIPSES